MTFIFSNWQRVAVLSHSFFLGKKRIEGCSTESLDGLRGMAAMGVVLEHLSAHGVNILPFLDFQNTSLGRAGVYLFFVLSSFLLTGKFFKQDTLNVRDGGMWVNYAWRRAARICPAYIFLLLVYTIFPSFRYDSGDFLKHVFFIEGRGHFWTIPVEVFFYLAIPVVVSVIVCLLKKSVLYSCIVLVLLECVVYSFGLAYQLPVDGSTPSLFPFLPAFLMGALAALVNTKMMPNYELIKEKWGVILEFCSLIILFLVGVQTFYLYEWVSEPLAIVTYGVLWSSLLLTMLYSKGFLKKIFSTNGLRFLGAISFGIYLWHVAILGYLDAHIDASSSIKFIAIVLTTLVVAIFSYALIERPFIKLKLSV
ncbi:MAG: acyltransferase [Cyanobacteria bacterium J06649_4]